MCFHGINTEFSFATINYIQTAVKRAKWPGTVLSRLGPLMGHETGLTIN